MSNTIKSAFRPLLYNVAVSTPLFSRYMGWRRARLKLNYISRHGNTVASGPFAGMRLLPEYSELPKFLGTYEAVLYPAIYTVISRQYDVILNIGCAEGYYAVGFAHAMPQVRVEAFDTDSVQRARCRENADLNGVSKRVETNGHFDGKRFDTYNDQRVLVICDIEGSEIELLRPDLWQGLKKMDFIIELHEKQADNMLGVFQERFAKTHELTHIARQLFNDLAHIERLFTNEFDQLAAIYENRFGPTSWLLLLSREYARY